ncbi:hypothetical protein [Nocardia stercoris]|uniref:Uncharacterized protein n=1 Tax=Nocardia stercoris TaxID=2483361 RepID=A0A3M2L265_9NOCA|nr:hypothetical protein [Nocardia stercoris]RMI30810.1 hypothetical protein EBN03_19285 [Nocardia stercoris]
MSLKTIAGSTLVAVAAVTAAAGGASAAPTTPAGGIALRPVADDTAAQDVAYLTLSSPHSRNIESGASLGGTVGALSGILPSLAPVLLPTVSSTLGPAGVAAGLDAGSGLLLPLGSALVVPLGSALAGGAVGGAISSTIPASDVPDGVEWHGVCNEFGNCY